MILNIFLVNKKMQNNQIQKLNQKVSNGMLLRSKGAADQVEERFTIPRCVSEVAR